MPSWSDKLLGEVIRLLLEAYYEPQFSEHSHGFRPARGCLTALREVANTWTGTTWFIEGDIARCFDELDHSVMLQTLGERIHDHRRLLAGQCELCGQLEKVRVHQIRKLSDLDKPGQPQPEWAQIMARRRRKTLVVCERCHATIHPRRPTASITESSLESPVS